VDEPHGSSEICKDFCFRIRKKALRGKSHGHFKHETRLKRLKNYERQEGNQTLQVFVAKEASFALKKFFDINVP
jgi:hypothetical protein